MATPKLTVCLDSYNYADFLPRAIESVLEQTFVDFELVIQDDCSTDGSFEIAQRYADADSRVVARRNPRNLGMIGNRNVAIAAARGEYLKLLHADDFLAAPTVLEKLVAALDRNPAVALVAGPMLFVDEAANPVGRQSGFQLQRPIAGTSAITRCLAAQQNLIGAPSAVMYRRALGQRGFDPEFHFAADLEMWFHLLEQGCFAYLADPVCAYRRHGAQVTRQCRKTLAPAAEHRALLDRYLHQPYVPLKRAHKRFLEHEALRRLVQRSRRVAQRAEGAAAVAEYGRLGYLTGYPVAIAARAALQLHRGASKHVLAPLRPKLPVRTPVARPLGINVVGFFKGEFGLGESARAFGRAAQATGLPCALVQVPSKSHRNEDVGLAGLSRENPYRVNLMAFSFDYARRFYRDQGRRFFAGRHNAALWYWEAEQFPAAFHSNFDYYDEIWVVTEFCRRAIAAVSPLPVLRLTYPLSVADPARGRDRRSFGIPQDAFAFLFVFDYNSQIVRKNPVAAIRAFRQAFHPGDDAVLVLKTINGARRPEDLAEVQREVEGLNVICLDSHLSGAEVSALFTCADAYLSLHRSEGLGLGLAQAMYFGKPVVATGYSGNLEFMHPENSLLVRYRPVQLEHDYGPYHAGLSWAEPDVEHAAELMRRLYLDRPSAVEIGKRAAADVRRCLDPAKTCEEIWARILAMGEAG